MLIDLKAHYLDLLVSALEAGGNACLHRPAEQADRGTIYVTRSPKDTRTEYVLQYAFEESRVAFQIEFSDQRPKFQHAAFYVDGLERFFPELRKALNAKRLANRSHEPERGAAEPYNLRAARPA